MTKVYVPYAWTGNSIEEILGAFDSKELAEKAIEKNSTSYYDYDIEEFELNKFEKGESNE